MIISEDSYIRLPPKKLNAEQTTVFNAITYSIDICDVCYDRLSFKLHQLNTDAQQDKLFYADIFSDVWSIINSSTIFLNLVARHFKETPNTSLVEVRKAKKLRNSNQHIDERIGEVYSSKNLPIYGSLSWRYNISDSAECILSILSSGSFTHHDKFQTSITGNKSNGEIIENIVFKAIVREKSDFLELGISLDGLMDELAEFISRLEKIFTAQIEFKEGSGSVERHAQNMLLMFRTIVIES